MIEDEGAGFDEIHKVWPSISEEDFEEFKAIEATAAKQKQRQWGKDMQKKNVAPHNLVSRVTPERSQFGKRRTHEGKGRTPTTRSKTRSPGILSGPDSGMIPNRPGSLS